MVDILANLITQTRQLSSVVKVESIALTQHLLKQSKSHDQHGYFSSPYVFFFFFRFSVSANFNVLLYYTTKFRTGQSLLEKLLRTILFCVHDQLPNLFNPQQQQQQSNPDFPLIISCVSCLSNFSVLLEASLLVLYSSLILNLLLLLVDFLLANSSSSLNAEKLMSLYPQLITALSSIVKMGMSSNNPEWVFVSVF
jgi:hypothetical protein